MLVLCINRSSNGTCFPSACRISSNNGLSYAIGRNALVYEASVHFVADKELNELAGTGLNQDLVIEMEFAGHLSSTRLAGAPTFRKSTTVYKKWGTSQLEESEPQSYSRI